MLFTEQLYVESKHIFTAIHQHPFIRCLAEQSLERNQLIHYVKQDFQYLNTYVQLYGLALAKCTHRDDMRILHKRIGFVLDDEGHAHENFCRVAHVRYEDLQQQIELAPTAHTILAIWYL